MIKSIQCQGNILKGELLRTYRVEDDTSQSHEVTIVEACPFTDLKNDTCKNCLGVIVASNKKEYISINSDETKDVSKIYRDTFTLDEETKLYKESLTATEFYEKQTILYEVSDFEVNPKTTLPYRAFDRPSDYKTACINCTQKCKDLNVLRQCDSENHFCNNQRKQRVIYV